MKHNFSRAIEDSFEGRPESGRSVKKDKKNSIPNTGSRKRSSSDETNNETSHKHPGGRKTNAAKGLPNRKKYSLTLLPDTYEETLRLANEEGISFSVYVQRALAEYKKKH